MDAWERLMLTAKHRLSEREGSEVSWREIVRRAGFDDGDFGRVSYHIRPRTRRNDQHFVPAWLIDALEPVLPVARIELEIAAAQAAGYYIPPQDGSDRLTPLLSTVTGILEDDSLPAEDRARVGLDLITAVSRILARLQVPEDV